MCARKAGGPHLHLWRYRLQLRANKLDRSAALRPAGNQPTGGRELPQLAKRSEQLNDRRSWQPRPELL